jgi:1,4-dihydroxy-6-naphthoate synthase
MKQKITLAYSPDTDDAFMVYAIGAGLVDTEEFEFELHKADIQELNEAALTQKFDVTAISIAAFPHMKDNYKIMTVGASIGDEFGPAIVVPKDSEIDSVEDLTKKRIAVPGLMTSAYYAATSLIGEFTPVPMHFLKIPPAVEAGEVDAGILIHEMQINCEEQGFKKIDDLGNLWNNRYSLPLPLGTNAIKRSLGDDKISRITKIMRKSVEVGLENRTEVLGLALDSSKADLTIELGDKYISMYVNHRSLHLQDDVREAMQILYDNGAKAGLCEKISVKENIAEA